MEINIDRIKGFPVVTAIQIICGVIISGFLFLFLFKRNLFLTLDYFRLTVLAISVTSPILLINGIITLFALAINNVDSDDENFHRNFVVTMYIGSILTIPVIYSSIVLGYFFKFNLKQGIITLIATEVIIFILFLIVVIRGEKKKNK